MTNCNPFLGATNVINGIFSGDAPLALLVFSAAFSNAPLQKWRISDFTPIRG